MLTVHLHSMFPNKKFFSNIKTLENIAFHMLALLFVSSLLAEEIELYVCDAQLRSWRYMSRNKTTWMLSPVRNHLTFDMIPAGQRPGHWPPAGLRGRQPPRGRHYSRGGLRATGVPSLREGAHQRGQGCVESSDFWISKTNQFRYTARWYGPQI